MPRLSDYFPGPEGSYRGPAGLYVWTRPETEETKTASVSDDGFVRVSVELFDKIMLEQGYLFTGKKTD